MVDVGRFVDGLKVVGVEFFADVPDSLLKGFYAYVTDACVVKKLLHHFYSTNGGTLSLSTNGVRYAEQNSAELAEWCAK